MKIVFADINELIKCRNVDNYWTDNLYLHFSISGTKLSSYKKSDPAQVELDVRCLQVLRALIHNKERKLPEEWKYSCEDVDKYVFKNVM